MPVTIIALKVFLLFLPGFLALIIQESLGERKPRTELERIFIILLYDVFVFGAFLGFLEVVPKLKPFVLGIGDEKIDIIGLSFLSVLVITFIAVALGVLFGACNVHGFPYGLLRKFKITYRTGRVSVWNDTFYEKQDNYVVVHLEDGTRIFGWARDFSADPSPPCLFIADAQYLGERPEDTVSIKGPGVLVTNDAKIRLIEFLSPEEGG